MEGVTDSSPKIAGIINGFWYKVPKIIAAFGDDFFNLERNQKWLIS